MDRSLWNLDRSVRELAAVRKALRLEKVHLMGHSWGGSLVTAYVLNDEPAGIESLVLAGPLLSTKRWIEDANILRTQLPQDVQDVLTRNEQAGTTTSKEYQDATQVFYSRFLYHQKKPDRPTSCAESPANDEIYQLMWGPTEFNATGNLLSFDVTDKLSGLKMPVTFFIGRYDEARLETIKTFQAMIPGSTVHVFENSGHLAPIEEYQAYAAALATFLVKVDTRSLP
jgi:proline iminopeptidase